jgi:hypothetical protein
MVVCDRLITLFDILFSTMQQIACMVLCVCLSFANNVLRICQVILLDTRYHRDPLLSDGTILGNSQWTWLEKELNGPASAITIIGSSIQVYQKSVSVY